MRLFLAAWPDSTTIRTLAALPRPEVPGVRWTSPESWHVTVAFIGPFTGEVADLAGALAAHVGAGPVAARIGPATRQLGERVLCVPVDGLVEVAGWCDAALGSLGLPVRSSAFRGHLTVARSRRSEPGLLAALAGSPCVGGFTVGEVAIVRSSLPGTRSYDPDRPYETIDSVPVRTESGPGRGFRG